MALMSGVTADTIEPTGRRSIIVLSSDSACSRSRCSRKCPMYSSSASGPNRSTNSKASRRTSVLTSGLASTLTQPSIYPRPEPRLTLIDLNPEDTGRTVAPGYCTCWPGPLEGGGRIPHADCATAPARQRRCGIYLCSDEWVLSFPGAGDLGT